MRAAPQSLYKQSILCYTTLSTLTTALVTPIPCQDCGQTAFLSILVVARAWQAGLPLGRTRILRGAVFSFLQTGVLMEPTYKVAFEKIEDAAEAYQQAALEIYGE